MRIGQNPSKSGIQAFHPHALGVALITFIPSQDGYFTNALEILKIQIASLHQNTAEPFDLLVFDNGSCAAVQDELHAMQYEGKIDWLMLSAVNLGKTGALNWILSAMPNEWVCYSDSDVLFREGWERVSRELLSVFPDAGVASAQPSFFENLKDASVALQQIQTKGYNISSKQPEEWIAREYAKGLYADEAQTREILKKELPLVHDLQGNPRAFAGACHMQFLAKRERLQQILPLPSVFALSTEEDREFDTRIDQKGWLRLSTLFPYVVHLGNHLEESLLPEVEKLRFNLSKNAKSAQSSAHKANLAWKVLIGLNRIGFMRRLFKRLYMNLFEYYSLEKK